MALGDLALGACLTAALGLETTVLSSTVSLGEVGGLFREKEGELAEIAS